MRARRGGSGRLATAAAAWALLLVGCSSGGSGGTAEPATYRIVATVSGLSGAGLTLHSSLGDDLAVTASGEVAFPTRAPAGTAYAVSVARQPTSPWQTCAVTGGTGTMGAADAALAVTCATDRFEIGGTVTGLEGSGLVVSLNGTYDAALATTGAFTFAAALESGATFAVTVVSQPAGQACAVTGGSGTVAGADVTTVAVACATSGYPIGGTVRGLLGSGLVLANGGELLPIASSGGFAFSTPVLHGRSYAVTVSAQPTGPAQTCEVEDGAGTATAAVTDVVVRCASTFQSWSAPTALGARWPDSATMVHHAHFEAGGIVTDKGPTLAMVGAAEPARYALEGLPGTGTRYGGGPFPHEAVNYQAAGASALDLPGDLLVCAVVKPTRNRPYSGFESPIVAKGVGEVYSSVPHGGWVLRQSHESFSFGYQYTDGDGQSHPVFAYIQDFFPDQDFYATLVPPLPLVDSQRMPDPSYVVVCGGRSGDQVVVAVNSWTAGSADAYAVGYDQTAISPPAYPPPYALDAATTRPLTLGGFDATTAELHAAYPSAFLEGEHTFDGYVFETAVWSEPATRENVQAKMAPFLGLDPRTVYVRNREAAWLDAGGRLHVAGRNAPRVDPVRGYLFGLQSWNRVSWWLEPNPAYPHPMVFPAGENLALWARTPASGADAPSVTLDPSLAPPGDQPLKRAQLVTLPAGAALSVELDPAYDPSPGTTDVALRNRPTWDATGPIQGQLWVRAASSGTLRIQKTDPAPGSGGSCTVLGTPGVTCEALEVDLSLLAAARWNRVSLDGAFTADAAVDGAGRTLHKGTLVLENPGPDPVSFYAWGVQLTQLGGGGDLSSFDPGAWMYDWNASMTHDAAPSDPTYQVDALVVGTVAESTAATGFCLGAEASMPPGLGWSAPFARARTAAAWTGATATARLYVAGQDGTANAGRLCFTVAGATYATLCAPVPGAWTPDGAKHLVKGCMSADGTLRLSGDDVELGRAVPGLATPDLAGGTLLVGNERAAPVAALPAGGLTPWHGWVSRLLVCRDSGDGADCR